MADTDRAVNRLAIEAIHDYQRIDGLRHVHMLWRLLRTNHRMTGLLQDIPPLRMRTRPNATPTTDSTAELDSSWIAQA